MLVPRCNLTRLKMITGSPVRSVSPRRTSQDTPAQSQRHCMSPGRPFFFSVYTHGTQFWCRKHAPPVRAQRSDPSDAGGAMAASARAASTLSPDSIVSCLPGSRSPFLTSEARRTEFVPVSSQHRSPRIPPYCVLVDATSSTAARLSISWPGSRSTRAR